MIKFDVKRTVALTAGHMRDVARNQRLFATALALTRTAQDVKKAFQDVIRQRVDRPSPWTTNSVQMRPATKKNLVAEVWFKDDWSQAPGHYLAPQVYGGGRKLKRFERALKAKGYLPEGMYAVPGRGAKFDAYGNISRGQIMQVLSALGAAEMKAGYSANRTAASIKRRGGKLPEFFVGRPGAGRLPLGVYQRKGSRKRELIPIIMFIKQPQYSVRLPVFDVAKATIDATFPEHLGRAIVQAKATAR